MTSVENISFPHFTQTVLSSFRVSIFPFKFTPDFGGPCRYTLAALRFPAEALSCGITDFDSGRLGSAANGRLSLIGLTTGTGGGGGRDERVRDGLTVVGVGG
jgi:hypothetical protein